MEAGNSRKSDKNNRRSARWGQQCQHTSTLPMLQSLTHVSSPPGTPSAYANLTPALLIAALLPTLFFLPCGRALADLFLSIPATPVLAFPIRRQTKAHMLACTVRASSCVSSNRRALPTFLRDFSYYGCLKCVYLCSQAWRGLCCSDNF